MTAQFAAQAMWSKRKLPSFEKVFKIKKKAMTAEEMFKVVQSLNAQFGGEDKRGEAVGGS